MGAEVIDADKIGHKALLDKHVRKDLTDFFGKDITGKGNLIDRKKLAARAFLNKKNHKGLCDIVHPWLSRAIKNKIKAIRIKKPNAVVIIDAAVLIEIGLLNTVDKLIAVKTNHAQQKKRAKAKWGLSDSEIAKRIKLQIPLNRLVKKADFIIDNNGDLKTSKQQVKILCRQYGN